MNTITYPCGCSVSRSMFGNHEILFATPCYKHSLSLQEILKELAIAIFNVATSEDNNVKHPD